MFRLRAGSPPAVRHVRVLAPAVIVLSAALGGCSSRPPQQQVVAQAMPLVRDWSETEEDGREAQVPPPVIRRRESDDPSEPWSPNYGPRGTVAPLIQPQRPPNLAPSSPPKSKFASADSD